MDNKNVQELVNSKILPLIKNTFTDNLNSVIIYGSSASGSSSKFSDINTLILLEKNSPSLIIRFGKEGRKILKKHKVTPLLLTIEEFLNSSDVFPMEYNDILDNHFIAYGDTGILDKLDISGKNLRHQLEERLRGLINQLRQMLTASAGRKRIIKAQLLNIPGILTAVFRSALRLKQVNCKEMNRENIFISIKNTFGTDFSSLLRIDKNSDVLMEIETLMNNLSVLTAEIDRLDAADAE